MIIEKQREFYKNAKFVKKYRKTVKQQNTSSEHQPTTLDGKVRLVNFFRIISFA